MPPTARRPPLVVATVLALTLAAWPGAAQAPKSREQALEEIRRDIGRLEERLAGLREKESTLADRLETTRVELGLQEQRLKEAVAARELAAERVATGEQRVAELTASLEESRRALSRRLAGLYRLGRHGPLRLLLSIDAGADPLPALRSLRFLARRDARTAERYVAARDQLTAERVELVAQREEMAAWEAREAEQRDALLTAADRQERLLASARTERREADAEAAELERQARRLAELMRSLAGREGETGDGPPIQEYRGVLDWPTAGEVTTRFGPRRDPRYRTQTPHNGIEIATPGGGEVAAVFPGKVLYADNLEGYGPTVVVLHPGRAFTLYAGLSVLLVSSEDVLTLGESVGVVSDRLYFEIRVDGRPRDPLEWLR